MSTRKTNRNTINVVCENCGNNFKKTLSEYKRTMKLNRKNFCSLKCNYENKKATPKYCICCDAKFIPRKNSSRFCSSSCNAKFNNVNRKGIKYNISEAGLVGLRKSIEDNFGYNVEKNKEIYSQNVKHCKECDKILSYGKRNNLFCDIICKRNYNTRNSTEYQVYKANCQFKFNLLDYPNEFDFTLIEKYGWYKAKNHGDNLNGISRDHMVSIKFGFKNNIDYNIINHPANCKLMRHNDNVSKHSNCSITIDELLCRINRWNIKYNSTK